MSIKIFEVNVLLRSEYYTLVNTIRALKSKTHYKSKNATFSGLVNGPLS